MNKPVTTAELAPPKVTTGPIAGSRKVYTTPEAAPDLRVPRREVALTDASEPPVPVYDPSGPYTDANAAIDVATGLPRPRIAWVKERGGVEEYEGRPIQPVDDGNVTEKHRARNFANTPKPWRASSPSPTSSPSPASSSPSPLWGGSLAEGERGGGAPTAHTSVKTPTPNPSPQPPHRASAMGAPAGGGEQAAASGHHPLTQLEWARAGVITKEMIFIAERENIGRRAMLERAQAALEDGESFGALLPAFVTPEFVRS